MSMKTTNPPTVVEGFDELCLFNFIIPSKKGRVTIAAHKLSDDVNLKTEKTSYNKLGLFNLREVIPCTRIIQMNIFSRL